LAALNKSDQSHSILAHSGQYTGLQGLI